MESFFFRYRNLLVLLSLLLAQIIGLAVQVRRNHAGRTGFDTADSSGVRLIRLWANAVVSPVEMVLENSKTGVGDCGATTSTCATCASRIKICRIRLTGCGWSRRCCSRMRARASVCRRC